MHVFLKSHTLVTLLAASLKIKTFMKSYNPDWKAGMWVGGDAKWVLQLREGNFI